MRRLAQFVLRGGRRRAGAAGELKARPCMVIFDFDGTIADTLTNGFEILNLLAAEFGYRPLAEEDIPKARDMRTREILKFLNIPTRKMHRIARRGTEELGRRIHAIQPLPGMPETLGETQALGFRLGILTSNSDDNVRAFLQNHQLEIFEFVKTCSKLLGKGRVLRGLLKNHNLSPKDVLFVGDEVRDIQAAQETGVHVAAVTWGYNSRKALESQEPDYLLESPTELLDLLKKFPQA